MITGVLSQVIQLCLVISLCVCLYFPARTLEDLAWYTFTAGRTRWSAKIYEYVTKLVFSENKPYFKLRTSQMMLHLKLETEPSTVPLVPMAVAVDSYEWKDTQLVLTLLLSSESPANLLIDPQMFFIVAGEKFYRPLNLPTSLNEAESLILNPWRKNKIKLYFDLNNTMVTSESEKTFIIKIIFNDGAKYGSMTLRLGLEKN